jgi:hypothetical protein
MYAACAYVCMALTHCMRACIHAYMHTCIRAYMHTCIHACVCVCVSMYDLCAECLHVCLRNECMHVCMTLHGMHVCMHVCMCVCMYACMYACMCIWMCVYDANACMQQVTYHTCHVCTLTQENVCTDNSWCTGSGVLQWSGRPKTVLTKVADKAHIE